MAVFVPINVPVSLAEGDEVWRGNALEPLPEGRGTPVPVTVAEPIVPEGVPIVAAMGEVEPIVEFDEDIGVGAWVWAEIDEEIANEVNEENETETVMADAPDEPPALLDSCAKPTDAGLARKTLYTFFCTSIN